MLKLMSPRTITQANGVVKEIKMPTFLAKRVVSELEELAPVEANKLIAGFSEQGNRF